MQRGKRRRVERSEGGERRKRKRRKRTRKDRKGEMESQGKGNQAKSEGGSETKVKEKTKPNLERHGILRTLEDLQCEATRRWTICHMANLGFMSRGEFNKGSRISGLKFHEKLNY
jgi:hypothetical protein